MIVETMNNNGCTCHISDDAYRDKTPEEVNRIVRSFSDFIVGRLKDLKEKHSCYHWSRKGNVNNRIEGDL